MNKMPQQIVELHPSSEILTPGSTLTVEVFYSSGEVPEDTFGLNHILNYDSRAIELIDIDQDVFNGEGNITITSGLEENGGNQVIDNLPDTDSFIGIGILELSRNFPGTNDGTAMLYSVEFRVLDTFTETELVNRIVNESPANFEDSDHFDTPIAENVTLRLNQSPIVENPIADLRVDEDSIVSPINLFNAFEDIEDAKQDLNLRISNNTNQDLITPVIDPVRGELALTLAENASGTAEIMIEAEDSYGGIVEEAFTVTVDPVNDPPVVENAIDTMQVKENGVIKLIELFDVFEDIEDADQDLTYRLTNNTNEELVKPTLDLVTGEVLFSVPENISELTAQAEDTAGATVDVTINTISINWRYIPIH
jgi:hypothetical protein